MTCVMFATPSFERRPCVEYIVSLCDTQRLLTQKGIDYIVSILGGDPYLGKCRNSLVRMFLADYSMATDIFFIDDDIGWPAHKVVEFLERPEDIVCGFYPKKQDSVEWPGNLETDEGKVIERNGVYRAHLVPTGFMRIKRHVMEKMAQNVGKYLEPRPGGEHAITWNIFEARWVDLAIEELLKTDLGKLPRETLEAYLKRAIGLAPGSDLGQFWGEDYWFSERWRQMGGTVWVDPDIPFVHVGRKAWSGNFMDAVKTVL